MRAVASARIAKSRSRHARPDREQDPRQPLHRTGEGEATIQIATAARVNALHQLECEKRGGERQKHPGMSTQISDEREREKWRECEKRDFESRETFAESHGHRSLIAGAIALDVSQIVDREQDAGERSCG